MSYNIVRKEGGAHAKADFGAGDAGVCIFLPSTRYTEDEDTVLLARAIYALGKDESYETKLKLGSVVMNRVENAWFPDDLGEVLSEPQQFPAGSRYDADSLRAAHELISGRRALDGDALY